MNIEEKNYFKKELINRYKYLYENAHYVLAPLMHKQTEEEFAKTKKKYNQVTSPLIYLSNLDELTLISLENFLFSETQMKFNNFYTLLEHKKTSKDFLENVNKGLELLKEKNSKIRTVFLKESLDIWNILKIIRDYIMSQNKNEKNKKEKLEALDEYFKISRYKNNGKIITSGYNITRKDFVSGYFTNIPILGETKKYIRTKSSSGINTNNFIKYLNNEKFKNKENNSILTEKEKQEIYLEYHDEIAWDKKIICKEDTYFTRPENTKPCHKEFIIKEENIFIDKNNNFYQICPNCGYITSILNSELNDAIQQRIIERCKQDKFLERKMILYSELYSLDKQSEKDHQLLIKR